MEPVAIATNLHQRFCDNLRARRKELGLTQQELADRMQTSQPNIAALEAGRYVPLLTTIEQLADALDCSVESLLAARKAPKKISA